uniref:Uncharacterized protein n=1 Tax=Rhizophora mucronata TaxID=61149 RepID=A0A2P2JI80_RHIMU
MILTPKRFSANSTRLSNSDSSIKPLRSESAASSPRLPFQWANQPPQTRTASASSSLLIRPSLSVSNALSHSLNCSNVISYMPPTGGALLIAIAAVSNEFNLNLTNT